MADQQQLMIPGKISVGFQNREGTYTGKLAYVVYYDQKGVLRKEKSWNGWRDQKIPAVDFDNVPTEGFVLNKGVGGNRHSYGWNVRNEYIRVYDPRDFEFEISVANLLFILREGDCSRGKGLEGKFVYAWSGTELVLLPVCSLDYENSKTFTELQTCSVKAKDLIPGASYMTKQQQVLTYLGRLDYHTMVAKWCYRFKKKFEKGVVKAHVFWNGKGFVFMDGLKQIAKLNSDAVAPDLAELIDKYIKSPHGSKPVELFTKAKKPKKNRWGYYDRNVFAFQDGDVFIECDGDYRYDHTTTDVVYLRHRVFIKDGVLRSEEYNQYALRPGTKQPPYYYKQGTQHPWVEPTNQRLFVRFESGSVYQIQSDEILDNQTTENDDGEED